MNRTIRNTLALVIGLVLGGYAAYSFAWTQRPPEPVQNCQVHSPYGWPVATPAVQPICRQAYLVGYDAPAKLPRYVTYTLTPPNALGCVARTNAFVADQSIQDGARPDDYSGTGYDRGHMAPDGDMSWDQQVEYESFLMTNMSPQAGSLNRGIWKLLETSVRGWTVQRNQVFTIYAGNIYASSNQKIGNGVIVPHSLYKVVINQATGEYAAWQFPHVSPYPNLGNDLTLYRVPVANLEASAKVDFKFPANGKEIAPGQEWVVDFGALTKAKRAKCGGTGE